MALIEKQEYQSEVLPISQFHQVQVRVSNLIIDDKTDEIKAVTYHRYVLAPDADLADQPAEVSGFTSGSSEIYMNGSYEVA